MPSRARAIARRSPSRAADASSDRRRKPRMSGLFAVRAPSGGLVPAIAAAAALIYHGRSPLIREARMSWSGIILVVVGALLLANNFDLLSLGWLRQWWPALLIVLGLMSIVRPDRGGRRGRADGSSD